jgi:hypothetical protein
MENGMLPIFHTYTAAAVDGPRRTEVCTSSLHMSSLDISMHALMHLVHAKTPRDYIELNPAKPNSQPCAPLQHGTPTGAL